MCQIVMARILRVMVVVNLVGGTFEITQLLNCEHIRFDFKFDN